MLVNQTPLIGFASGDHRNECSVVQGSFCGRLSVRSMPIVEAATVREPASRKQAQQLQLNARLFQLCASHSFSHPPLPAINNISPNSARCTTQHHTRFVLTYEFPRLHPPSSCAAVLRLHRSYHRHTDRWPLWKLRRLETTLRLRCPASTSRTVSIHQSLHTARLHHHHHHHHHKHYYTSLYAVRIECISSQ